MAVRIILFILGIVLVVNLVLTFVSLITGVNLYQKYGKQLLIAVGIFVFIVAALYVTLALIGLG